jgi:hypothetical protein
MFSRIKSGPALSFRAVVLEKAGAWNNACAVFAKLGAGR